MHKIFVHKAVVPVSIGVIFVKPAIDGNNVVSQAQ